MERIGVYKTNVNKHSAAETIIAAILQKLPNCKASFDLEDCDNVLRVESLNGKVDELKIRNILHDKAIWSVIDVVVGILFASYALKLNKRGGRELS